MTNDEYLDVARDLSILNMSIENHPFDEAIDELEDKILSNQYKIAVVGDFSSGKSTFINALIGEELLYNSNIEANEIDDFGKQLRIEKQIKEKIKALEDKKFN